MSRERRRPRRRLLRGSRVLGAFATLVYVVLFAPIVVVVVYAFNKGPIASQWTGFTTHWFADALANDDIRHAIGVSLRIAVASALVSCVLGTAAALAITRRSRTLRLSYDGLMYLTLVVPELVIAVSLLTFFVQTGFTLGPTTVFLGHTVFNVSLVTLVVRARFQSMGSTLEQASADLGASPLQTLRHVTLPLLGPAIAAGALLAFTFSFDDIVISSFASGSTSQTWPMYILSSLRFGLKPDLNAAATLMLGVTLLLLAAGGLLLWISRRRTQLRPVTPALTTND